MTIWVNIFTFNSQQGPSYWQKTQYCSYLSPNVSYRDNIASSLTRRDEISYIGKWKLDSMCHAWSRSSCRPASSWPRRWRVEGLANSSSQAWLASPPLSRRIQTVSYSSLSTQPLTHISRHSSPLSGQVWLRWRSSSSWNHTKRQEPRVWKNLSD